ncbi:uncharacterized protein EAE97_010020 [Botrytis byssoidea]|uniref:Uncharacterized protein n=1 Tax=Botrytis byssoidea TaxID=139641 RepID=A0A9P5I731_9HELO|nr:uncharacterized protein EAE97_010020 [Botrytis byssoidea]KAF7927345.1 hypothetical protein EAE97_010020 [Botrytis byssoidea]
MQASATVRKPRPSIIDKGVAIMKRSAGSGYAASPSATANEDQDVWMYVGIEGFEKGSHKGAMTRAGID